MRWGSTFETAEVDHIERNEMETGSNLERLGIFALLVSLMASLASCAATGEPFKPGESVSGQASLYIYRVRAMVGAAYSWDVNLDDHKITELRHGGYFYTPIVPGSHMISVKFQNGVSIKFLAEADKRYYFRVSASANVAFATFVLERVEESLAVDELPQMKLQPGTPD